MVAGGLEETGVYTIFLECESISLRFERVRNNTKFTVLVQPLCKWAQNFDWQFLYFEPGSCPKSGANPVIFELLCNGPVGRSGRWRREPAGR